MAAEGAGGRMVAIWDLVAQQAASRQARVSVQDVCAAVVAAVQVGGAGMLAVSRAGAVHVICVTDQLSRQLADIELTVGEGPRADASAFGGPVLVSDLAHHDIVDRWPAFAPAAREAGAAAVFAFPLQIGAIRVGVLEMYRRLPSPLSTLALGDALLFADTATLLLLEGQQTDGRDGEGLASGRDGEGLASGRDGEGLASGRDRAGQGGTGNPAGRRSGHGSAGQPMELGRRRAEIDQATGMLTEQLGTGIAEAFVRLRAYAYAQDRQLADVARDIVTRRLRLDAAGGPGTGTGPAGSGGSRDGTGPAGPGGPGDGTGPAGAGDREPDQGGAG